MDGWRESFPVSICVLMLWSIRGHSLGLFLEAGER